MKTRLFAILLLATMGLVACGPSSGQPVFAMKALPDATSIPTAAKTPATITAPPGRITSFDVSPDGNAIAIATSRGASVYTLHGYKVQRSLQYGEIVSDVAWSPDGSTLAIGSSVSQGSDSGKARLVVWDASTWKNIFEPDFGSQMVNETFRDLAWSPDGRFLAIATDVDGVLVLDMQTGQTVSHQKDFAGSIMGISWSPDGLRLVATNDMAYGIRRWRLIDDQAVRLFDPRASSSTAVAWSPNGSRIASGHYLGAVCLWTAATNRCDGFIKAHRSGTFSLAWSPDSSELATGGGVIRIWDTNTGKLVKGFGEDNRYMYNRIEWTSLNGLIVSLQSAFEDPGDTVLRLWDLQNGSITAECRGTREGE